MEQKVVNVVNRFKILLSEKITTKEIVVFGSRAREDNTENSDLDILVVVEIAGHSVEKVISDAAWEAGFPDDILIVPVVITLDQLRDSPVRESSFIKNVYREGILV
ncbi:nucleotidyltransferase domain-containing protein [Candidatus Magnetomonas plexicatena]|uniref:nucleotidyltransferase domain-containing protein n=1 Tax=Candidatus Magnetomonas plexicatena TaxID=2552947 RepID=UPI001C79715F|nr:nucleotidyltransferase domain-containing protein [Nitrospirales bacterium LBB_01]